MQLHGVIHQLSTELKTAIVAFLVVLSIGFFGGLSFVNNTTSMQPSGIESHYLGNEDDENAEVMKFKKNKREMLTLVHNHILSLAVIFFLLSLILTTTSLSKKLKLFLIIEPFCSLVFTFGGLYVMWLGVNWFKYIVIISGILMTFCYLTSVLLIFHQLIFSKNKRLLKTD